VYRLEVVVFIAALVATLTRAALELAKRSLTLRTECFTGPGEEVEVVEET
jgi:hypothetical protein